MVVSKCFFLTFLALALPNSRQNPNRFIPAQAWKQETETLYKAPLPGLNFKILENVSYKPQSASPETGRLQFVQV